MNLKPESVNKPLEKSFRNNWRRPALSNYKGETLLYSDLARSIAKMHLAYQHYGVVPGDKVVIISRNQAHWAVCFLAAMTYGAVPVPLLHEFKPGNIHYLVNHSDAKILFVERAIWDGLNAEDMPGLTAVIQIEDYEVLHLKEGASEAARPQLEKMYKKAYPRGIRPEDIHYHPDEPDELAILSYTSGTSGFSKGVMIPYRAVWSNVYRRLVQRLFHAREPADDRQHLQRRRHPPFRAYVRDDVRVLLRDGDGLPHPFPDEGPRRSWRKPSPTSARTSSMPFPSSWRRSTRRSCAPCRRTRTCARP